MKGDKGGLAQVDLIFFFKPENIYTLPSSCSHLGNPVWPLSPANTERSVNAAAPVPGGAASTGTSSQPGFVKDQEHHQARVWVPELQPVCLLIASSLRDCFCPSFLSTDLLHCTQLDSSQSNLLTEKQRMQNLALRVFAILTRRLEQAFLFSYWFTYSNARNSGLDCSLQAFPTDLSKELNYIKIIAWRLCRDQPWIIARNT